MRPPAFRAAPAHVRVPASSANLGSGFDALGLALGIHDDVLLRVADEGLHVDVAGEGAGEVSRGIDHLVVRAAYAAFDRMGGRPHGLDVVCANRIPQGRGLGSSAAAIVAGVLAARALVLAGNERLDDTEVLALATEMEGHPDNVAAALSGGLNIAWTGPAGPRSVGLVLDERIRPLLVVPVQPLATATARSLLPSSVPHVDAAHAVGRAALAIEALTRRPDLLLAATEDRLHQGYRAPAMPAAAGLLARLRGLGFAAVVSGAGPSLLVLVTVDQLDAVRRVLATDPEVLAGRSMVREPVVDVAGAHLVPGVSNAA
ncbi:MAG: homoserine kinase [Actinomycetes bacterium]